MNNQSRFLAFFLFILLALTLQADPMYITFVDPQSQTELQKTQITFQIDKKDVPLTEFFLVNTEKRDPEVLWHPAGRRQYLFLYDLIFSTPENLVQARRATETFIKKLNPDDLVALVGISATAGVDLFCNFTKDRNQVLAALNALSKPTSGGMIAGPEGNYYAASFSSASVPVTLIPEEQFSKNVALLLPQPPKEKTKPEDLRPILVQGIVELLNSLATVEGRKNILLFSPGFDTAGLSRSEEEETAPTMVNIPSSVSASRSSRRSGPTATLPNTSGPTKNKRPAGGVDLKSILKYAGASDCHFHVPIPANVNQSFYNDLCNKTHGVCVAKTTPVETVADEVLATDKSFYVIGWDGKPENQFKQLHSVKIEVGNTKLLFSETWIAPVAYDVYGTMEKKMHLAEAIWKNYNQSSDKFRFWCDFAFQKDHGLVPLFAQITGSEILKPNRSTARLDFYSFTMDDKDELLDFGSESLRFDLSNLALKNRLSETGIKIWKVLLARKGPTFVREILMNPETGETYTHSAFLDVKDSGLTLSYPFFLSNNYNWIVWPKAGQTVSWRGAEIQYPYAAAGNYFIPDLMPNLGQNGESSFVYFKIYNVSPELKDPPIRFRLLDTNNAPTDIDQFGLMQEPRSLEQQGQELVWKIVSLPKVASGEYRFKVEIGDNSRKTIVSRGIEVHVQ